MTRTCATCLPKRCRGPLCPSAAQVGRTKIITLHSGVWVENAIDRQAGAVWRMGHRERCACSKVGPLLRAASSWLARGAACCCFTLCPPASPATPQGRQPAPARAHNLARAPTGGFGRPCHRRLLCVRERHCHRPFEARGRWASNRPLWHPSRLAFLRSGATSSCHVSGAGQASAAPLLAATHPATPPTQTPAGCYLPLTAVLGGRLFLRPSGFQEASRDVIRLSPDIAVMLTQQVGHRPAGSNQAMHPPMSAARRTHPAPHAPRRQNPPPCPLLGPLSLAPRRRSPAPCPPALCVLQGFMSCEPDLLGLEEVPLHVSLQAIPAKVRLGCRGLEVAQGRASAQRARAACCPPLLCTRARRPRPPSLHLCRT